MDKTQIDIKENYLYRLDHELLAILLKDRSSGKNIIWATDNYAHKGSGYQRHDCIEVPAIIGYNGNVVSRVWRSQKKSSLTASSKKRKCLHLHRSAISRTIW